MFTDDTVAMHIHRKEHMKNNDITSSSFDYYRKCIHLLGTEKTYLIFSNDVEWCKQQDDIRKLGKVYFVHETDKVANLLIMSYCRSLIITNSAYSCWAAYLSDSNVVYYPLRWKLYNDAEHVNDDIVLPHWHGIPIE